eukprot:763033-Prorocentrum_minimum.AAC.2
MAESVTRHSPGRRLAARSTSTGLGVDTTFWYPPITSWVPLPVNTQTPAARSARPLTHHPRVALLDPPQSSYPASRQHEPARHPSYRQPVASRRRLARNVDVPPRL